MIEKKQIKRIGEIDGAELAVRIMEIFFDLRRPMGMTAEEVLDKQPQHMRNNAIAAAKTSVLFVMDAINNSVQPS